MFFVAGLAATVFLGGWMPLHIGGFEAFNSVMDLFHPLSSSSEKHLPDLYYHAVQMDLPRIRIDQLLTLEWKYLLPINLFNILIVALIVMMGWHF